ncbi:hypothetical protein CRUP_034785 [Coryphaenoides rupestris]|nr:hypothetical protein CRUP_034785 [Coryphaenoides rupestris]
MHQLFSQVLSQRDLSRAGDLFSLEDAEIEDCLSQALEHIKAISCSPDYLTNDNDQAVVEICITRITTAIRGTGSIERHGGALNYSRPPVMVLAVPVAFLLSRSKHLTTGCESALLYPMRSRRIYVAVLPDVPLSLTAFTACLWVKPAAGAGANRTVLFSYGTRRNPYEIQLLFSAGSALFTVGGEAHLVEGRGVLRAGGVPEWLHLCGAWNSQQGHASLWADGRKVASAPGVADGRNKVACPRRVWALPRGC